ncbi:unnamed protein product [Schistocephalus solidus]|uniref:Reverse transcriptase domain-containing protein n=1 Tax=Schistocephalus solidus TaxID=70667 RepID=A0A183SIS9_SCHSO|nr:unnamed protein product [Schistocephalus solidus]
MYTAILRDAYRAEHPGLRIAFRNDGCLLNSRRIRAPTRLSTTTVPDLLFVDDCILSTTTEEDTQMSMDLFAASCTNFGPAIIKDKKVFIHQLQPNTEYSPLRISGTVIQIKIWATSLISDEEGCSFTGIMALFV